LDFAIYYYKNAFKNLASGLIVSPAQYTIINYFYYTQIIKLSVLKELNCCYNLICNSNFMENFFERCIRNTKNFFEDFEHQLEIRNAKRQGASNIKITRMQMENRLRINARELRRNLGNFFEDVGFTKRQESRQTFGQKAAEKLMDLYEGIENLAQRAGPAFIQGARTLGQKFREFGEWLGEVAQTCKNYVTEKGQQAMNSAREGVNNIAQMLHDLSRGRSGRGSHQR